MYFVYYILKVEVSKFDALEEVSAELKLKQLLWDSLYEWDKLQQEWLKVGKNPQF
jgi:dynein heavy chain